MKLVLFTPVINTSAIGRMASLVSRKLIADGHKLTIIKTESDAVVIHSTHDFGSEPISWKNREQVEALVDAADGLIYQIGNNYNFHQGGLEWLQQAPGVVCLHDYYLACLFMDWSVEHREEADSILKIWYEPKIASQFFKFSADDFIKKTSQDCPLTEWICSMAKAVITHSSWGMDLILRSCAGPIYAVPLAYDAPGAMNSEKEDSKTAKKFSILTLGHINENKRAASVISAIAANKDLRKKVVYRLVGKITPEDKNKLRDLAKSSGVMLDILGEVENSVLEKAIVQADLVCCLRWPALESASASAIESMLYGKPTLVTDTGFYSEIPNDCTVKINPNNEIAEIESALIHFLKNREFLTEMGKRAQIWASQTFTADNYANKLTEIIHKSSRTNLVKESIEFFAKQMCNWEVNSTIGLDYIIRPMDFFRVIT